ncbi:Major Facilitator Superfamily protein [Bremerella volcania]|uniref:Major Facilitator Superfamily protein n=1 Tax=Bremerella volcania TaxID=2527984 RepID=A0A518CDQ1_9BACT|nr:MFS transporter [Bremerella volcania]QDU77356.1 Major Facilitator Superfamily protein [Bremerella volcania]
MNRSSAELERTSRGANENAGMWALGNGLVSTTLVSYFAQSLGAQSAAISWIIAAPKLVGVLRWFAPGLLKLGGGYRTTSTWAFLLSTVFLLLLPLSSIPNIWPSTTLAIVAIVICWCMYHLAEYCGYVVFVAWLMQLVSPEIRGRFFGLRERWLTAGNLIGFLFAGLLGAVLRNGFEIDLRWIAYPLLAIYGAFAIGFSVLPLRRIPEPESNTSPKNSFLEDWQHWSNPRARWFLLYGTWFSAANGLFSTLLYVYPYRALDLSLFLPLTMAASMRLGQSLISRPVGVTIDRIGWRSVMICGQVLIAFGPLLFSFGTMGYIAGNLIWIAYALINVALPIAVVDGRHDRSAAPPLALYFAWTGLVYGLTALAGQSVADFFVDTQYRNDPSAYNAYFLVATLARLSAVLPLVLLPAERKSHT